MPSTLALFQLIVLIFSVMIHEISHGLMAERLGDSTARLAGRITLNPIKHIDIFGSIILPIVLVMTGSPVILGWAKPVPYNPNQTRNPKTAGGKIAFAGPLSNFLLAVIFAALFRLGQAYHAPENLLLMFMLIILMNLALGVFNLVPIPPLDGSKVLFSFLPESRGMYNFMAVMEQYGFIVLLLFIYFGGGIISAVVSRLFYYLAGMPF